MTDPDGLTTTYAYDGVGDLAEADLPNGLTTTYAHDALDRVVSVETRAAGGALVSSYAYTYEPAGHITRVVEQPSGRAVDYTYDVLWEVTGEAISDPAAGNRTFTYTYDAVGNRISRNDSASGMTTYTYDADHRLLHEDGPAGTIVYEHDAAGNVTRRSGPGLDVHYAYDVDGHLVQADDGTDVADYLYDADGVRVRKTVNSAAVTNYLADKSWDLTQVLLETDGSGAVLAEYVIGRGPISQQRPASGKSFYLFDGGGSARALANAGGAVTDRWSYDGWGNVLARTGSTANELLYRGQRFDAETGFYHLRARSYDPRTGRFTSLDPLPGLPESPLTLHGYLYGSNDPVNRFDPSGRFDCGDVMISIAISACLFDLSISVLNIFGARGNVQGIGRRITNEIALSIARMEAFCMDAGLYLLNYTTWFGALSVGRLAHVQWGWAKIALATISPITFNQDDTHPTWFAYVYPGGPLEIFFCDQYWKAPLAGGFDTKSGTILHELSHEVHGTGDYTYGTSGAKALAVSNPNQATMNADNYEYNMEDNF